MNKLEDSTAGPFILSGDFEALKEIPNDVLEELKRHPSLKVIHRHIAKGLNTLQISKIYKIRQDWVFRALREGAYLGDNPLPIQFLPIDIRNRIILHQKQSGIGVSDIAKYWGISRTRVRQIIKVLVCPK